MRVTYTPKTFLRSLFFGSQEDKEMKEGGTSFRDIDAFDSGNHFGWYHNTSLQKRQLL